MALGLLLAPMLLHSPMVEAAEPDVQFMARLVAQSFFRGLLKGEVETALPLCARSFNFDGEQLKGTDAIKARLGQLAARAREQGLRLKRVEVLTVPQALKRFGPPPARIKKALGPGRMVALARFNMMGSVAVLARQGGFWRVHALTD